MCYVVRLDVDWQYYAYKVSIILHLVLVYTLESGNDAMAAIMTN